MELTLKEIKVHGSSYVDPNGFVFLYQGEFHRGIRRDKETYYRSLFQNGFINYLSERCNLVETKPTELTIPEANCYFVVWHKKITPETYCVEWCPSMLKNSAQVILDLCLALNERDYLLQDAYPWNILYPSARPFYLDLTSIVPNEGTPLLWPAYQQFLSFFLYPLLLGSMGKAKEARLLLQDYISGLTIGDVNRNMNFSFMIKNPLSTLLYHFAERVEKMSQEKTGIKKNWKRRFLSQEKNQPGKKVRKRFFEDLKRKIERIPPPPTNNHWTNYYNQIDKDGLTQKAQIIDKILADVEPESVLDIGCNVGRYSIMAAKRGARVIAMDSNESCIESLYQQSYAENHRITPVIGDIICPVPAFGFLSGQFPSSTKRFKSDLVLCLALMHHLHINGRQPISRIATLMNELSTKAVIFEYVDPKDENNDLMDCGREIDYCLDSVLKELSRYFKTTLFDSDRDTRKIILCKKK